MNTDEFIKAIQPYQNKIQHLENQLSNKYKELSEACLKIAEITVKTKETKPTYGQGYDAGLKDGECSLVLNEAIDLILLKLKEIKEKM